MTTKINLLAVSLFLPVFISAQNVIPEPAQYRPAKGEFVLSIAENKALDILLPAAWMYLSRNSVS